MGGLPECVSMQCVWYPWKSEEGDGSLITGVKMVGSLHVAVGTWALGRTASDLNHRAISLAPLYPPSFF